MLAHVVRFFQRYALFFAGTAGMMASRLIIPEDSNKWLTVAVACVVMLAFWKLLYNEEVTGIRADGKPGSTILVIVANSIIYWLVVPIVIFVFAVGSCASEADGPAIRRCFDWQSRLMIIYLWLAAIAYGLGLWAAIRARREASDSTEHSVFGAGVGGETLVYDTGNLAQAGLAAIEMADSGLKDILIVNANGVRVSLEKAKEAFRQSSSSERRSWKPR